MSAAKDFEYARKAMEYGVKYYLLKPVTYQEIKEKLVEISGCCARSTTAPRPRGNASATGNRPDQTMSGPITALPAWSPWRSTPI